MLVQATSCSTCSSISCCLLLLLLLYEFRRWYDLRSLSDGALDAGRRNHVTSGVGTPVTLQTSTTVSPSCTVTSSLDRCSIIAAGTVRKHSIKRAVSRPRPAQQTVETSRLLNQYKLEWFNCLLPLQ